MGFAFYAVLSGIIVGLWSENPLDFAIRCSVDGKGNED